LYILLVGTPLLRRYAMLAMVPTVVRGEKDVGVAHCIGAVEGIDHSLDEVVYRLQGLDPVLVAIVYVRNFVGCKNGQLPYPGGPPVPSKVANHLLHPGGSNSPA
jgi:hypothetical protein